MFWKEIIRKHRVPLAFTFSLVFIEAGLSILFPLFIGFAVEGALKGEYTGVIQLGLLGVVVLLIGAFRRYYDSRFYAKVYEDMGIDVLSKNHGESTSIKSARLNMAQELVEFLENSLPELINTILGLIGVMILLATLNIQVFYGSLLVLLLNFAIYVLSSGKTYRYNQASNDELEKQVQIIHQNKPHLTRKHLRNVMKWNIKLSDLETLNFSLSWMILLGFMLSSILISAHSGMLVYGTLLALIMYVFQYIESLINLPYFYQNWLRLKEIRWRLMN